MEKAAPAKRKYDATRRQAQAEETRRRILDAAHQLFMERGYAGATIDAIAKEAGVALKTVYAVFENKRTILLELLNRSSSDRGEEHLPVLERPSVKAVTQERDPHRQMEMFAQVRAGFRGARDLQEPADAVCLRVAFENDGAGFCCGMFKSKACSNHNGNSSGR